MSELKIITAPSVYLVGRQAVDEPELTVFLKNEGVLGWQTDTDEAGEKLVEIGGRLCYMSFAKPRPGGNEAYIKHILEVGHGSVLEHAVFSLIITGVSRSLTHELVRHRVGLSYSQLSQRFVDESDVAFVAPPSLLSLRESAPNDFAYWRNVCGSALEAYTELLAILEIAAWQRTCPNESTHPGYAHDRASRWIAGLPAERRTAVRKAAHEAARSVLPECTETKIFITGNARAWRHFLELRGSAGADAEIRRLAVAVFGVLQAESPNLFGDYRIATTEGGVQEITTDHRKV